MSSPPHARAARSSVERPLDDRVALVTGGGSGIGRAIALQFAEAGAAVAICGRRTKPLESVADELREHGVESLALYADVTQVQTLDDVVKKTTRELGGLDLLVNNAGIARQGAFAELTDAEIHQLVDVDLKGPIFSIRAAHAALLESADRDRRPAILNISSNVTQMAVAHYAAYASAKAGVDMLTRCLALELAPDGIRVNAILPGVVATPIFETMMSSEQAREFLDGFDDQVPIGRVGRPDDVARMALALCDPRNDWVTGVLLPVDGGLGLGPS